MPYESPTSIDLPARLTIWQWLFTSANSPVNTRPASQIRAYIDATTDFALPYTSVRSYATHISTALCRLYGHTPGASTAIFATNTVWWPVAMFSILRIGGAVTGASPAYGAEEMAYALQKANSKYLFTLPEALDIALQAADKVGLSRERVFLLDGERKGFLSLQQLAKIGEGFGEAGQVPEYQIPKGQTNGDITAFLSFSSGTTGLPKAVMISHQNMIAQCLQVQPNSTPGLSRVLAALPFFHITGLVHILNLPILNNADVIMIPKYSLLALLETVQRYKLTELLVVPPILIQLVRDPIVAKYDTSHVRTFWSGAAPLSAEIITQLAQRFPQAGMKQGYGMTETCSCVTMTHPGDVSFNLPAAATVGKVVPSTTVKIVDPAKDDAEVGVGVSGEILAKGPQIVRGYLNNPEATAGLFTKDGFIRTGDVGMMDESGMLTITDRIKEMIKVNGVPVAPAELEDALLQHPDVEDCAVISVPHDTKGEVPRAFVVPKRTNDNAKAGEGEASGKEKLRESIIKWIRDRKARIKWLEGGVEFIDLIPKSPSGKILRRVLKDGLKKVEDEKSSVKVKARL